MEVPSPVQTDASVLDSPKPFLQVKVQELPELTSSVHVGATPLSGVVIAGQVIAEDKKFILALTISKQ